MGERITVPLPEDLQFLPKQALSSWDNQGFIERQCAKDVWKYVQDTVKDQSRIGVYLAGPMGIGKSAIMFYVVHKARGEGWFVIYIPLCDDWLKSGHPSPAFWYAYLFDAVLAGLQYVRPDIRKKYAYCFPPNSRASWDEATRKEKLSLQYLQDLFIDFRSDILREKDVEVILAFDETQALFGNGVNPLIDPPFSLIDWSRNFKRGCVFVTATADSSFRRALRAGHERYVLNVGSLTDAEVASWFDSPQFANVVNQPDFTEEYIAEIRSLTGDIPRELVMLSDEQRRKGDISLSALLEHFADSRQAEFEGRFIEFQTKYPQLIQPVLDSLVKFFVTVHVRLRDIDLRFFDIGLAYDGGCRVLPLSSNAIDVFFKMLFLIGDGAAWSNETVHELRNLDSDNASQVGLAFERLYALNLLQFRGPITLNYSDLSGIREQRVMQIRHFLTIPADQPKKSWKDYPVGTLVAHSANGEARLDFIFFGGTDFTLFFEVTVAVDVSKAKYPLLSNQGRVELILSSIGKWMGGTARISDQKQLISPRNYPGVIEYIVVSSRLPSEGKLSVGQMKKYEFSWLKLMDRQDLRTFFPDTHIQKIATTMSRLSTQS
ncbi:hypothetical protein MP228_001457 [Amoeboaphelidium protococcarum]|nr:hypothetical protein MP228_001457 [Amoeboaphelidium protococcarum]